MIKLIKKIFKKRKSSWEELIREERKRQIELLVDIEIEMGLR